VTVHTNVIFAKLLLLLFSVFPSVNWFSIFEVALAYVSFSLATTIILINAPGKGSAAFITLVQLAAAPFFYTEIHNTKLTPLIALCGLAAVYFGSKLKFRALTALGCVVTGFASFLRMQAFLIGAVFAVGIVAADLISESGFSVKTIYNKHRRTLIVLLSLLMATVVFAAADVLLVARDQSGAFYREYNAARGKALDFRLGGYGENSGLFNELSISENDYRMLRQWNFADPEKFDTELLNRLSEIREKPSPQAVLEGFLGELLNPLGALFIVLSVVAFLFCEKKTKLMAAWALPAFSACLLLMCAIGRTTRWVTAGMTGSGILSIAVTAAFDTKIGIAGRRVASISLAAASAAVLIFLNSGKAGLYANAYRTDAVGIYSALSEDADRLFLMDTETQPEIHRAVPVFSSIEFGLFGNVYTLGGWDTESPAKNSILERFGVNGSVYRALLERYDLFLCDTKNYSVKRTYVRENYDDAACMSLFDVVDGYYIFAFSPEITAQQQAGCELAEAVVEADIMAPGFIYIGGRVIGDCPDAAAAYINVYENNAKSSYRARIVEREDGFAVFMSVLEGDLLFNDLEIEIVLKTEEGLISAANRLRPTVVY